MRPGRGNYEFTGQKDVAEFIREAQQEGLWVILRPGPYSCAEWEFGGLPSWLLKDPKMVVRSSNPEFMAAASRWMKRLGKELAPLQSAYGGPILAVQVENEYASFGNDSAYMHGVKQMLLDAGFDKAMLFTADGDSQVSKSLLPELPAVINFGLPTRAKTAFAKFGQGAAERSDDERGILGRMVRQLGRKASHDGCSYAGRGSEMDAGDRATQSICICSMGERVLAG